MKWRELGRLLFLGFLIQVPKPASADPDSSLELARRLEDLFVGIAERAVPAVVNVETEMSVNLQEDSDFRQFHRDLPTEFIEDFDIYSFQENRGTGFIVDPSGIILTNHHIVAGSDRVFVRLHTSMVYPAEYFSDESSEVAVLKIKPEGPLPYIQLGDSSVVKTGQFAIAIGHPLRFDHSFNVGNITGTGRSLRLDHVYYEDFLQTDAAINLGNSGGPLLNLEGKAIGINTAIFKGVDGLGFAIPINIAKRKMDQLLEKGRVSYGFLGVETLSIQLDVAKKVYGLPNERAVLVQNVAPSTPAEFGGIRINDIILEVNGEEIIAPNDLTQKIGDFSPGTEITLKILRDKEIYSMSIILEERTDFHPPPEKPALPAMGGMRLEIAGRERLVEFGLENLNGLLVVHVGMGTMAHRAGIRRDDVLVKVDGNPISSVEDFERALIDGNPGDYLTIDGYRRNSPSPWLMHRVFWLRVVK